MSAVTSWPPPAPPKLVIPQLAGTKQAAGKNAETLFALETELDLMNPIIQFQVQLLLTQLWSFHQIQKMKDRRSVNAGPGVEAGTGEERSPDGSDGPGLDLGIRRARGKTEGSIRVVRGILSGDTRRGGIGTPAQTVIQTGHGEGREVTLRSLNQKMRGQTTAMGMGMKMILQIRLLRTL